MANLFFDPIIIAAPQFGCTREVFEDYVRHLVQWQELSDCEWSKIFFSSKTIEVLFSEQRYPIWDEVEKIIAGFGIDHIQPKDIVVLVDGFLQKFIKIEEWLGIEEFICDKTEFTPCSGPEAFKSVLGETLVLMVVKSHIEKETHDLQLLITDKSINQIEVRSTILLSHFKNSSNLPDEFQVDGTFKCCSNLEELSIKINYPYLWYQCNSNKGLERLAFLYASAKRLEINIPEEQQNRFVFGEDFSRTVIEHNFKDEKAKCERLLRAMADIILGTNLHTTHAIRKDRGPNSDQLVSGAYKAWRKDIDYEYHLHYWKATNLIVFSNVVTHENFTISRM